MASDPSGPAKAEQAKAGTEGDGAGKARGGAWAFQIISTLIYFALVVGAVLRWETLGWGPLVWLAASILVGVIRGPYAKSTRQNVIVDDRKNLSEKLLLAAMFLAGGILPVLHLATGVFSFADYSLPVWASIAGAALQAPFLWLFWRSHADLGKNWSVSLEVREDHGLVTRGVYSKMRHPMYAAIWIAAIAQPLLIHNWIAGVGVLPAFLAMYLIRTPQEEKMMRDRFGDAYDRYAARTGRIFPRFAGAQTEAAA